MSEGQPALTKVEIKNAVLLARKRTNTDGSNSAHGLITKGLDVHVSAKREVSTGVTQRTEQKQFSRHASRSQLLRTPKQVKTKKVIVMLPLFLWKLCNTCSQSTSCVTSIFEV